MGTGRTDIFLVHVLCGRPVRFVSSSRREPAPSSFPEQASPPKRTKGTNNFAMFVPLCGRSFGYFAPGRFPQAYCFAGRRFSRSADWQSASPPQRPHGIRRVQLCARTPGSFSETPQHAGRVCHPSLPAKKTAGETSSGGLQNSEILRPSASTAAGSASPATPRRQTPPTPT